MIAGTLSISSGQALRSGKHPFIKNRENLPSFLLTNSFFLALEVFTSRAYVMLRFSPGN